MYICANIHNIQLRLLTQIFLEPRVVPKGSLYISKSMTAVSSVQEV